MGWCIVALAGLVVLAGGGGSRLLAGPCSVPNALRHTGYHVQPNADMDLNNNGGLMAMTPYGTAFLTGGPGGRGLDFDNDTDFISTGAVDQQDNYMNLFFGCFNAPETGTYEFRIGFADDQAGIWIDLDQDGIFEVSGDAGAENISWLGSLGSGSTETVSLAAGEMYMFAVTHGEMGGLSRLDAYFKTPLMGSQVVIKPSDPAQAGIWRTVPEPCTMAMLAVGGLAVLRRRRVRS